MRICGFNKTTLLDYPGKVASTIFLGGCNFRCPFCQNGILVVAPGEQPNYSQEELLTFLKKKKGDSGRGLHFRRGTYTVRWSGGISGKNQRAGLCC